MFKLIKGLAGRVGNLSDRFQATCSLSSDGSTEAWRFLLWLSKLVWFYLETFSVSVF